MCTIGRFVALYSILGISLSAAFAFPTSLNVIPTAETLAVGHLSLDIEPSNSGKLIIPSGEGFYGLQLGICPAVEVGADVITRDDTVYNLKIGTHSSDPVDPIFALGMANLTEGRCPQFYAVATRAILSEEILFGAFAKIHDITRDEKVALKIHGGALVDSTGTYLLAGAGAKIGSIFAQSDLVLGGSQNRMSLAAGTQLQSGLSVILTGYLIHNVPDTVSLTLSYQTKVF